MKHISAIKILTKHIEHLNKALVKEEKAIEELEMLSDYHFALSNAANIEMEILAINESIKLLQK